MVFFILSKYVTKWIGTPLFRSGLRLRNKLIPTRNKDCIGYVGATNYWMDMVCLIPFSKKILSLAIYDESRRQMVEFRKERQEEEQQQQRQSKIEGDDKNKVTMSSSSAPSSLLFEDNMTMMTDPVVTRHLSKIRVAVLDEYFRPSLIPNNRWSDVEYNWRYHLRIVAWARKEFLVAKYGPHIQEAMISYPQLRASPQLLGATSNGGRRRQMFLDLVHRGVINLDDNESNNNTTSPFMQLPPSSIIVKAFRMQRWNNSKDTKRIRQSMTPVAKKTRGNYRRGNRFRKRNTHHKKSC